MGLSQTIGDAVESAFDALGDLVQSATYVAASANPGYTPATGEIAEDAEETTVRVIFTGFKTSETDNKAILPFDEKAMVPAADLLADPNPKGDRIIRADLSVWDVKNARKDPAGAIWTIQIRKA